MEKFLKRIKERIYEKTIRDLCCCRWYDEEPLTKAEIEKLLKKIETNYN